MDYSSSEGAAAVLNKGYLNKVPTTTTFNNHSDDIHSKFDFVSIAKTFCRNSPQQRTLHYNGNMASNISDVLRSNKRTSMSMMMNAANPLDMFVGSNNNIAALPASGFARRLSAMNSTATASVMANAAPAASLRRPLKRIKLEGSCGDDGENVVAPPTVVLIPAQQHVMAFAEHQIGGSEDSNGDDAASHESLDHRSGSPGQGETLDGASGVRFREYQAEIWSEKFEELCLFRREHGHCHVPHHFQENQGLAQWVKRQRYQYKLKLEGKRSTLSDERVRLLNTIGFIWNSHDAVFAERLQDLILFKSIHGHCMVPSTYEANVQLAIWTKRQRRQYKKYQEGSASSMTPDRIAMLEAIGFVWDCRKLSNGKNDSREKPMASSPVATAPIDTVWTNQSSSVKNAALLAEQQQQQQQQRLTMMQDHLKNQLNGSNIEATNETPEKHVVVKEDVEDDPAPTAMPAAGDNSRQESPQQQRNLQQEQIDRVLSRMPKCEFFSFSRKFNYH